MRNLTGSEIRDLESRGIKPGVLVQCAYNNSEFIVKEWSKYEVGNVSISSKDKGSDGCFEWLKNGGNYATPVEQPDRIPDGGKTIDWEARRWELASNFYIHNEYSLAHAIKHADDFIREYRNTPMP